MHTSMNNVILLLSLRIENLVDTAPEEEEETSRAQKQSTKVDAIKHRFQKAITW